MTPRVPTLAGCALLAASGCSSPPDVPVSRVTGARVLGVRSDPPEAAPGQRVRWTAVVASPRGFVTGAAIRWALCMRPRTPADPISVSAACLPDADTSGDSSELGPPLIELEQRAIEVTAALPADACARIGPELPQTDVEGAPRRPPDPDVTGGYQMPVRLMLSAGSGLDVSYARQRVRCNLASAPAEIAREYAERYEDNVNPELAAIEVAGESLEVAGASLAVDERSVTLVAHWGADAKETYILFDPVARVIVERDENLEISWFSDAGEFEHDRTTPDPGSDRSTNLLAIDADKTEAHVWILLRDDRGGLATASLTLNVE